MHVSVTFRHIEATEPLREYALDKLARIRKYFPDPIQAHVVLDTEAHRFRAAVHLTLHNGIGIESRESTEDMYSSIDLVMTKIERQVRRYKDRIRNHKPGPGPAASIRHRVIAPEEPAAAAAAAAATAQAASGAGAPAAPAAVGGPRIIRTSSFTARAMTPEEAVMQMDLLERDFYVFTHAETQAISVVYRRRDGAYGLIETGAPAGA